MRLREGMRLTAPVYDPTGKRVLLQAGAIINGAALDHLLNNRITDVVYNGAMPLRSQFGSREEYLAAAEDRERSLASVSRTRDAVSHVASDRPHLNSRVTDLAESAANSVGNMLLLSMTCMRRLAQLSRTDDYTHEHSVRVAARAILVAAHHWDKHGVPTPEGRVPLTISPLIALGQGLLLHDIGKLAIPLRILHKPGKLTEMEYLEVQKHAAYGHEMIVNYIPRSAAEVVRHHHERWDGAGYPDGLAGNAIPEAARIAAVADVFDAMVSERPYKAAMPREKVVTFLGENAGIMFDRHVVLSFLEVMGTASDVPYMSVPVAAR